ncbi:MAG: hypothetical protein HWD90_09495 [Campylobacteraceae bacterium]|nr:hypothetical protein [Campylobacteraceae bacterium]
MGKIEKINLEKTIDYSGETISYLIKEDDTSSDLQSYEKIVHKIHNAKKTIQLSSTENISNEIIDALYENDEINIYILLKSFDKSKQTLERFDSKKPTVLREVEQLENNLIIIDNIAYIFINPLENKENIFIKIDENKTPDLKYIFNYYFWECASLEKLVDTIAEPIESPFPTINQRELDFINITNNDLEDLEKIYIPKDEKYKSVLLDKESTNKYVSTVINSIIYQNTDQLQIGNLLLKEIEFDITDKWIYTQNFLKEISSEDKIIPIDESWDNIINIEVSKKVNLGSIESNIIEEMNTTKVEFLQEKYIKEINFSWEVLPPSKPNNAKKANLYNDFEELDRQFKEYLEILNRVLTDLEKESGVISFFMGANRKAKQNLKKIEEYKDLDLSKLSIVDLEKFIEVEFKEFFESIIKSNTDFKENKKRKEAEDKWNRDKEQKTKTLEKQEHELKEKKLLFEKKEKNTKEFTKIEKEIRTIENKIDSLKHEINDKYSEFKYNPKQNEIKNFKKNKTNSNEYKKLNIPRYILPEVGVLYETNNSYFLEIIFEEDINKANELKQRYCDKDYKVVVGAKDE